MTGFCQEQRRRTRNENHQSHSFIQTTSYRLKQRASSQSGG